MVTKRARIMAVEISLNGKSKTTIATNSIIIMIIKRPAATLSNPTGKPTERNQGNMKILILTIIIIPIILSKKEEL